MSPEFLVTVVPQNELGAPSCLHYPLTKQLWKW